jgi:hypothetical protein
MQTSEKMSERNKGFDLTESGTVSGLLLDPDISVITFILILILLPIAVKDRQGYTRSTDKWVMLYLLLLISRS